MKDIMLQGLEFMGDNVRDKLKFCGDGVRLYPLAKIIHAQNAELDNESKILDYVFIDAGEGFKLGKYSIVTWQALIEGGAKAFIGDRVFIGPGSKILTGTYKLHDYYSAEFLPEGCNAIQFGDVVIKDDAYIGANAVVMPGVTIGEGAVIGANAFVDKNVEPWTINVGSPCKAVGMRRKPSKEQTKKLLQEIDWSKHL